MLLIGTRDGLYRAEDVPFEGLVRVLDAGPVTALDRADGGALVALAGGSCYRSADGQEWERMEVTADRVTAVGTGPGDTLYAGTTPSRLYRSADGGRTWAELKGLQSIPSRNAWAKRGGQDSVSAILVHPETPGRLVVAVEPAGVHLSDDGGDTWVERRYGLHDDVHALHQRSPQEYLAATGDGLYHTGDAGRTWVRLDTDHTYFEYTYFQTVAVEGGRFYTAAAIGGPGEWGDGPEAALFESADGDDFERVLIPIDREFPVSFGSHDGDLLAGTLAHDLDRPSTEPAHVLHREAGTWEVAGETPAGVWDLLSV